MYFTTGIMMMYTPEITTILVRQPFYKQQIELDSKIDEEEPSYDHDRDSMTKVTMILILNDNFWFIQLKKSKKSSKQRLDRSRGSALPGEKDKKETAKFGPSGKSSEVGMFDQNPSASDGKSNSKKQSKLKNIWFLMTLIYNLFIDKSRSRSKIEPNSNKSSKFRSQPNSKHQSKRIIAPVE